jgi:hypothetical protein
MCLILKYYTMKTYGEWRYSSTFLDLDTRWRWVVSFTPLPLYPPGKIHGAHWTGVERLCKEAVVSSSKHCHGICLEGLRKTAKNLSQDSRYPGRSSNRIPPKWESKMLPLFHPVHYKVHKRQPLFKIQSPGCTLMSHFFQIQFNFTVPPASKWCPLLSLPGKNSISVSYS